MIRIMLVRRMFHGVIVLVISLSLTACGGGGTDQPSEQTEQPTGPQETGFLTYKASYEGTPPDREQIDASANPECGKDTILGEDVVVNESKTLCDMVIAVQDGPSGYEVDAQQTLIDQENCIYKHHVATVKAGQRVKVTDSDEGMHNVRATQDGTQLFNLTTFKRDEKEVSFDDPGVVKLECNVHPWMEAWVYVTDHGNAEVTGEDGQASLEQLPEGDYTFEAWHEEFDARSHEESIEANAETTISDTYSSTG